MRGTEKDREKTCLLRRSDSLELKSPKWHDVARVCEETLRGVLLSSQSRPMEGGLPPHCNAHAFCRFFSSFFPKSRFSKTILFVRTTNSNKEAYHRRSLYILTCGCVGCCDFFHSCPCDSEHNIVVSFLRSFSNSFDFSTRFCIYVQFSLFLFQVPFSPKTARSLNDETKQRLKIELRLRKKVSKFSFEHCD